ncbi:ATP-dependent protease LonB [Candidatus Woesearchaeota archaeon]|nr:ATP-dependent protease LonB [Candidatus Woesearchaeota archaeon]
MEYKTTADLKVSSKIIDQIIGQEHAVEIVKKAAKQKRNVLLIGEPGTGKSMLAQALAELLTPSAHLEDVLCFPNETDPNNPKIKVFSAEEGQNTITKTRMILESGVAIRRFFLFFIGLIFMIGVGYFLWTTFKNSEYIPLVITSGLGNILWLIIIGSFLLTRGPGMMKSIGGLAMLPKPLITHKKTDPAPFIDATGAHAGALLGDVLHDPLQTGGFGTPAHERVMPGMIHKANQGVLFVDEVATLSPRSQQELLTIMQEGKYSITGQSERSSGSMVRTEPVPCKFVMVASGNVETIQHMHPALRSRIRGYGYEIYMNTTITDTHQNRKKFALFVAQEVNKDQKIPHFTKQAVDYIIAEAKKRAGMANKLTLRLRELGGLIRAAGDLATESKSKFVTEQHVQQAMKLARTLEQQMADEYITLKKQYNVISIKGKLVGRVNGLAVIGSGAAYSGIVLPIESEITPGGKRTEFIATGKLGAIAKEAVKNVSAIILKNYGEDIKEKYDIYVQFLQTHEGVEGDSASIAVATAIISALKQLPVRQDVAMTGSLSVRGEVLAIGGITAKVEAAIEAGIKEVIVPKANEKDISLSPELLKKIKITPVTTIHEVLAHSLEHKNKDKILSVFNKK